MPMARQSVLSYLLTFYVDSMTLPVDIWSFLHGQGDPAEPNFSVKKTYPEDYWTDCLFKNKKDEEEVRTVEIRHSVVYAEVS